MQPINTQFETEFKRRCSEEIARLGEIVLAGNQTVIPDYATYQRYVGQIQGLDRAQTEFCNDVNNELVKR